MFFLIKTIVYAIMTLTPDFDQPKRIEVGSYADVGIWGSTILFPISALLLALALVTV